MPAKSRFTRKEVLDACMQIVRSEGLSAVTARSVAARLSSSPKVIFGLFQNMEEVQAEIFRLAYKCYQRYQQEGMAGTEYPVYKASGMAYIRFAMEEKELFRLLFLRKRTPEQAQKEETENQREVETITDIICQSTGLSRENARLLHLEMWMYVHGIASTIVTSYSQWDLSLISQTLTDVYEGLKYRHKAKETNHASHPN